MDYEKMIINFMKWILGAMAIFAIIESSLWIILIPYIIVRNFNKIHKYTCEFFGLKVNRKRRRRFRKVKGTGTGFLIGLSLLVIFGFAGLYLKVEGSETTTLTYQDSVHKMIIDDNKIPDRKVIADLRMEYYEKMKERGYKDGHPQQNSFDSSFKNDFGYTKMDNLLDSVNEILEIIPLNDFLDDVNFVCNTYQDLSSFVRFMNSDKEIDLDYFFQVLTERTFREIEKYVLNHFLEITLNLIGDIPYVKVPWTFAKVLVAYKRINYTINNLINTYNTVKTDLEDLYEFYKEYKLKKELEEKIKKYEQTERFREKLMKILEEIMDADEDYGNNNTSSQDKQNKNKLKEKLLEKVNDTLEENAETKNATKSSL